MSNIYLVILLMPKLALIVSLIGILIAFQILEIILIELLILILLIRLTLLEINLLLIFVKKSRRLLPLQLLWSLQFNIFNLTLISCLP